MDTWTFKSRNVAQNNWFVEKKLTPLKTNMEDVEVVVPFRMVPFQVTFVNFSGYIDSKVVLLKMIHLPPLPGQQSQIGSLFMILGASKWRERSG